MVWVGSVQCPNCGAPIDSDVSICPYCYSSSPHSAPWQTNLTDSPYWIQLPIIFVLVVFVVILISDMWFGTEWIPQLLALLNESQQ